MAKRGRPKRARTAVVVNVKLYLDPVEDRDLVEWFAGLPAGLRAQSVMAALRGASLGEVEAEGLPSDDEVADLLGGRLW